MYSEWNGHDLGDLLHTVQDPVIAIEPDLSSVYSSTLICGWFGGDPAFELDPMPASRNLLRRDDGSARVGHPPADMGEASLPSFHPKFISPMDLLKMKQFRVGGDPTARRFAHRAPRGCSALPLALDWIALGSGEGRAMSLSSYFLKAIPSFNTRIPRWVKSWKKSMHIAVEKIAWRLIFGKLLFKPRGGSLDALIKLKYNSLVLVNLDIRRR